MMGSEAILQALQTGVFLGMKVGQPIEQVNQACDLEYYEEPIAKKGLLLGLRRDYGIAEIYLSNKDGLCACGYIIIEIYRTTHNPELISEIKNKLGIDFSNAPSWEDLHQGLQKGNMELAVLDNKSIAVEESHAFIHLFDDGQQDIIHSVVFNSEDLWKSTVRQHQPKNHS
jgi:hypothetical protein